MSWQLNEKEFQNLLKLPPAKRYEYFIKKVADTGVLWSLWKEGGWALLGDEKARECVPLWPHEKYASACAIDDWRDYQAKEIDLAVFLERWVSGMARDNRLAAVFPTPQAKGPTVEPGRLDTDFKAELSLYEE